MSPGDLLEVHATDTRLRCRFSRLVEDKQDGRPQRPKQAEHGSDRKTVYIHVLRSGNNAGRGLRQQLVDTVLHETRVKKDFAKRTFPIRLKFMVRNAGVG